MLRNPNEALAAPMWRTIVAQSFISASENAICGAHQKGKVFKAHMFEIYCKCIEAQMESDKAQLQQS
jgi:hypothetical protein